MKPNEDKKIPLMCRWFGHAFIGTIVLGSRSGLRRECKRCGHGEWVNEL